MANIDITSLTEATQVESSDLFVLSQGGEAKKITGENLISEFAEELDGHGGIASITLASSVGNVNTYTITYADSSTSTFQVTNGINGTNGVGVSAVNINSTNYTVTFILSDGRSYTTPSLKGDRGDTYELTEEDKGDIAELVGGIHTVEVSGSTPVINGVAGNRYLCGTVSSISITPPSNGIIDVVFTSGSTAAVVTLPNTVKMPEWYEVVANRTYEINIADGVYGSVMSWA